MALGLIVYAGTRSCIKLATYADARNALADLGPLHPDAFDVQMDAFDAAHTAFAVRLRPHGIMPHAGYVQHNLARRARLQQMFVTNYAGLLAALEAGVVSSDETVRLARRVYNRYLRGRRLVGINAALGAAVANNIGQLAAAVDVVIIQMILDYARLSLYLIGLPNDNGLDPIRAQWHAVAESTLRLIDATEPYGVLIHKSYYSRHAATRQFYIHIAENSVFDRINGPIRSNAALPGVALNDLNAAIHAGSDTHLIVKDLQIVLPTNIERGAALRVYNQSRRVGQFAVNQWPHAFGDFGAVFCVVCKAVAAPVIEGALTRIFTAYKVRANLAVHDAAILAAINILIAACNGDTFALLRGGSQRVAFDAFMLIVDNEFVNA